MKETNTPIPPPTPEELAELERWRYFLYLNGSGTPWDLDSISWELSQKW